MCFIFKLRRFILNRSGPCKLVGKYFEEFSNEDLFRNLKFINVDIDELQEIAAKAKVQDIPAFLAYRNGKAYEQYNGANRSGLKSFIEKYHSST